MGGDPRVAKLARVLVRYSVGVKAGDLFQINAPALAAPLIRELYREALLVGAHPFTRIGIDGLEALLYKHPSVAAAARRTYFAAPPASTRLA